MIKDVKKEVRLLSETDRVEDKLMLLSLYNEFYNYIGTKLSAGSIDFFDTQCEGSFDTTISSLRFYPFKEKTYDAVAFMKMFNETLEYNLNKTLMVGSISTTFYSDQFEDICSSKPHIAIIDAREDLSLEEKANIALTCDEFVRSTTQNCLSMYTEEFTETIMDGITANMCEKLPEFIDSNKGLNDVELYQKLDKYLKYSSKDYLAEKYRSKEIDFTSELNEFAKSALLPKITDSNRDVAGAFALFALLGIQSNDPKEKKEIRKETAELAGTTTFEVTKYAVKSLGKIGKTLLTQKIRR